MGAQLLSHVCLFVPSRTVAHQAPLSMDFPGKNTGVGCYFLLKGIFLTQGSNLCLLHFLHWQADCLPLSHMGSSLKVIRGTKIPLSLVLFDPVTSTVRNLMSPIVTPQNLRSMQDRDDARVHSSPSAMSLSGSVQFSSIQSLSCVQLFATP